MNKHILQQRICLISREGVCLLDMQQMLDASRRLGFLDLETLIRNDLDQNKITNGSYYALLAPLFGEQS